MHDLRLLHLAGWLEMISGLIWRAAVTGIEMLFTPEPVHLF